MESRSGQVIRMVALESVSAKTDAIDCVFDDSDASGYVMLAALLSRRW